MTATATRRAAELLFTLSAIGEITVGLLAALLPATIMGFLLGAPLDRAGLVVARMMGIAAAGLGLTWWPDRTRLEPWRLRELAVGFVGYNAGVGLVLAACAWSADRPLLTPWLVAAVHVLVAGAFAGLVKRV